MLAPLMPCGLLGGCTTLFISDEPWKERTEGFTRDGHYFKLDVDEKFGHLNGGEFYSGIGRCMVMLHGNEGCFNLDSEIVIGKDAWTIACEGLTTIHCWAAPDGVRLSIVAQKGEIIAVCKLNFHGKPVSFQVDERRWQAKQTLVFRAWYFDRGACLDEKETREFVGAAMTGKMLAVDYYGFPPAEAPIRETRSVGNQFKNVLALIRYMTLLPKINEEGARYVEECTRHACGY